MGENLSHLERERSPGGERSENLSPNLSHLPWSIGEKSVGATGFEPAT
jgi:hypothetical protein